MIKGKNRKGIMILVLVILLLLSGVLGATIAYFQDHTDVMKNTFVGGALFVKPKEDFVLLEQKVEETVAADSNFKTAKYKLVDGTEIGYAYDVLPGVNLPKRPFITANRLLMEAYLYVVVDTQGTFARGGQYGRTWTATKGEGEMHWDMDSHWAFLKVIPNTDKAVYYYKPDSNSNTLKGGNTYGQIDIMHQDNGYSVKVSDDYPDNTTGKWQFSVTFQAFICQVDGSNGRLTVEEAWNINFGDNPGQG